MIKTWIPYAITITLLSGVIYGTVQHLLRTSANDPQIEMAEDAARALAGGTAVEPLASGPKVDMANSLAPFLIFYNTNNTAVAGTGQLNDTLPTPPSGVFTYAHNHGKNRLTWQPSKGVRIAAVVVPYSSTSGDGFVLTGRNLREVEQRESELMAQVWMGWVVTMLTTLAAIALLNRASKHHS